MALQLDLFKTKRQRGTRPPEALEKATHIALADLIERWKAPGWFCTHIANGAYLENPDTKALMKRMGRKPGVADWMLIGPGGFCFLELKRKPNKLTEEQLAFGTTVVASGGRFSIAYSYAEAVKILKAWGVLQVDIPSHELTGDSLRAG